MKRKLGLFTIVMLCGLYTTAQQHFVDSLRNRIKEAASDSLKMRALYEYMRATLNDNTTDFPPYMEELIMLGKKTKSNWGLSTGYIISLCYYADRGNFPLSFRYGDSALAVLKDDTSAAAITNKAHAFNNLSNNYYKLADYTKALELSFKAVDIFKKVGHKTLASTYTGIANCYMNLNNYPKTFEYSDKAIAIAMQHNDKRLQSVMMMNKVAALSNLDRFREADSLLKVVRPMVEALQNATCLQMYYYHKSDLEQFYYKDTSAALRSLKESYKYAREVDDVSLLSNSLEGIIHIELNKFLLQDARKHIDSLFMIAEAYDMKDSKKRGYAALSEWYFKTGNYKPAYEYLEKEKKLSDTLSSEEAQKNISMIETRFNVAAKEDEIKVLKAEKEVQELRISRNKTLNYLLLGGAAVLLIITLLGYRNYRHHQKIQQQRINELETEKQLSATEAILKGEEQERARLAKDLHDGLGGMLSGIKYSFQSIKGNLLLTPESQQAFERSIEMVDTSIKEMRRVAHNMMPEALVKFGLNAALQDFCSDINQSGALKVNFQSIGIDNSPIHQTIAIAIYRIVQELINNVIKHAEAQTAIVQVIKSGPKISITVEDDGKGFEPEVLQQSKGIGFANIQNRVSFLKGKMDIHAQPGKGVSVLIEFYES